MSQKRLGVAVRGNKVAVALWGSEQRVAERLQELSAWGATEILAAPVLAGSNHTASLDRTLRLLGQVAQSV